MSCTFALIASRAALVIPMIDEVSDSPSFTAFSEPIRVCMPCAIDQ